MTKTMWRALVGTFVRHALSGIGVTLTAHGYVTADTQRGIEEAVVGAVVSVGMLLWGWWQKLRAALEAQARAELPPTASAEDISARMALIGYRRVLLGIRHAVQDARVDDLISDVLRLTSRVQALEDVHGKRSTTTTGG